MNLTYCLNFTRRLIPHATPPHLLDFARAVQRDWAAVERLYHLCIDNHPNVKSPILRFSKREQTFKFKNVGRKPVPSLLRGFTAPVNLEHDLSEDDLAHLAQHDRDAFVRWESLQTLMANEISTIYDGACTRRKLNPWQDTFVRLVNYASEIMPKKS